MKKILTVLIAASAFMMMTSFAFAADESNANPGDEITLDSSNVDGAPATLVFNPSPQIMMQCNYGALQFMGTTAHVGAFNVDGGKEYAMSYDSTKVAARDISTIDPPALFAITDSDSTDFTAGANDFFY